MMKRSTTFMACGLVAITLALAGCGRKGALEGAPDKDPAYPREYPAPEKIEAPEGQTSYDTPQRQGGPYRAYSNYPRPKQSSYGTSK